MGKSERMSILKLTNIQILKFVNPKYYLKVHELKRFKLILCKKVLQFTPDGLLYNDVIQIIIMYA